MSILQLPVEIVYEIYSLVSLKDAYENLKVCKRWYITLSPLCHYEIWLDTNNKEHIQTIKRLRDDTRCMGKGIQHLLLSYQTGVGDPLDQQEFYDLIASLPNLKILELLSFESTYLKYLNTIPTDMLKHLKKLILRSCTNQELYYNVASRFKNNITELQLIVPPLLLTPYTDLNDLSKNFKQLNELTLRGPNCDNIEVQESFHQILSEANSIERLYLEREFDWNEFDNFDYNYANSRITSIKLHVSSLSLFGLNKILSRLLSLQQIELEAWNSTFHPATEEELNEFRENLKRISLIKIDHYIPCDHRRQYVRLQDFWGLIRHFHQEEFLCDLLLDFESYSSQRGYIEINRISKHVCLNVCWPTLGTIPGGWEFISFMKFRKIVLINKLRNIPFTLNDLLVIIKGLLVHQRKDALHQIMSKRAGQIIDIRPKCMSLHTFTDKQPYDLGQRPLLFLKNVTLDNESLNQIGVFYPSIENITFDRCKIYEDLSTDKFCLDLSSFKNIKQFTLDFGNILKSEQSPKCICFVFQSPKSRWEYFYNDATPLNIQYIDNKESRGVNEETYMITVSLYTKIEDIFFKKNKELLSLSLE